MKAFLSEGGRAGPGHTAPAVNFYIHTWGARQLSPQSRRTRSADREEKAAAGSWVGRGARRFAERGQVFSTLSRYRRPVWLGSLNLSLQSPGPFPEGAASCEEPAPAPLRAVRSPRTRGRGGDREQGPVPSGAPARAAGPEGCRAERFRVSWPARRWAVCAQKLHLPGGPWVADATGQNRQRLVLLGADGLRGEVRATDTFSGLEDSSEACPVSPCPVAGRVASGPVHPGL